MDKAELVAGFNRVLSVLGDVIDSETARDPAWEETERGVEGAYADAAISCSKARMAFEDEMPTMDALVIKLKDIRYKDPFWPTDGANDAQMLRSVWHCFHNVIVAGKSFAPDDLSVMRNLYAALERAREKLTESLVSKSSEPEFEWSPAMLEGYVAALLKEVEYPTQREAVGWIAKRARKRPASTSTLRKTYGWQNRPRKNVKPRTTSEAQSGVSPAQNADAVGSKDVTDAVLDIEDKLHRQLVDDERDAVAWTLKNVGANEEKRDEAIRELTQGFRSGVM
ncbi:hypothetical protein N9B60_04775 [Mariniblastus sp.]|nr:hypothetical protein [Mariniblastus sp.]